MSNGLRSSNYLPGLLNPCRMLQFDAEDFCVLLDTFFILFRGFSESVIMKTFSIEGSAWVSVNYIEGRYFCFLFTC